MSEKRRDNKNRILHEGETQMPDGRYRFRYTDKFGERHAVYSWRLQSTDATPGGKKRGLSLREKEKEIMQDEFHEVIPYAKDVNVFQLVEKHVSLKNGVSIIRFTVSKCPGSRLIFAGIHIAL